jgi:hypothetical protein
MCQVLVFSSGVSYRDVKSLVLSIPAQSNLTQPSRYLPEGELRGLRSHELVEQTPFFDVWPEYIEPVSWWRGKAALNLQYTKSKLNIFANLDLILYAGAFPRFHSAHNFVRSRCSKTEIEQIAALINQNPLVLRTANRAPEYEVTLPFKRNSFAFFYTLILPSQLA